MGDGNVGVCICRCMHVWGGFRGVKETIQAVVTVAAANTRCRCWGHVAGGDWGGGSEVGAKASKGLYLSSHWEKLELLTLGFRFVLGLP